jgi:hypothetical protein
MLLIREDFEAESYMEESASGKRSLYITGPFAQAEMKNRNGRIYPGAILEREVAKYKKDFIDTKRALGEMEHPQSPTINPERASHLITEMTRVGNDFIGKAKLLTTPMGMLAQALINDGVKLGVSTRGLGSVTEGKSGSTINDDFSLKAVDIVLAPSGIDCFVDGIMEGVNFNVDGEVVEKIRKQILMTPKARLEEEKLRQFTNMIKGL